MPTKQSMPFVTVGPWGISRQSSGGRWYAVRSIESGRRGPFLTKEAAYEMIKEWNKVECAREAAVELLAVSEKMLAILDGKSPRPTLKMLSDLESELRTAIAKAKSGEA